MYWKQTLVIGVAVGVLLAAGAWASQAIVANIQEVRSDIAAAAPAKARKSQLSLVDSDLVKKLQQGGYTIFLRHGHRQHGNPSARLFDMTAHVEGMAPSDQDLEGFCLSSTGKESSRVLGQFLGIMNVPIGEVYASPLCRTLQTAKLAFPSKQVQVADSLSFLRYNYGSAEMRGKYGAELKALLSSPVAIGVNRAVVSHGNVLKHIGIDDTGLQELGFIVLDGDLNAIAITEPMAFSNLIYEIALSAP